MSPTTVPNAALARSTKGRLTGWHVLAICVAFFGTVFAANFVLVYLAVGTFRGVEVASSYKAGNDFGREFAAYRAQDERAWAVEASVTRDTDGRAAIRFEPREPTGARVTGLEVTARLQRPADRYGDRSVTLEERAGVYIGTLADVGAGNWQVVFEATRGGDRVYRSRNRTVLP